MGMIDVMVAEKQLAKVEKLRQMRLSHHKRLVASGIATKVLGMAELGTRLEVDDLMIMRKKRARDVSDTELAVSPRFEALFNLYAGTISPFAKVVQVQQLKPVDDLDSFDSEANIVSVGVITSNHNFVIDGLSNRELDILEGLVRILEVSAGKDIPVDKESLLAMPPTEFVQPGIPLV